MDDLQALPASPAPVPDSAAPPRHTVFLGRFGLRAGRSIAIFGIAMVFVAGIVFSYALWQTGTLWWGRGFHMAWHWAQSFLYGVPDSGLLCVGRLFHTHPVGNPLLSGGHDGPEGSLLAVPILFLVLFAIHRTPRGQQPPLARLPATTALNPISGAHPLSA